MEKNCDNNGRWRDTTVAFRMSKAESDELNMKVKLSGLTKQKYMIERSLQRDIVVIGNTRVYKALRDKIADILRELKRLQGGNEVNGEILIAIQAVTQVLNGLNKYEE